MNIIIKEAIKSLREAADNLEAGNSNITEDLGIDILSTFAHINLSKDQACSYLNINKSRFGELLKDNKIPKGRKERGFRELRWYKDELIKSLSKGGNKNNS